MCSWLSSFKYLRMKSVVISQCSKATHTVAPVTRRDLHLGERCHMPNTICTYHTLPDVYVQYTVSRFMSLSSPRMLTVTDLAEMVIWLLSCICGNEMSWDLLQSVASAAAMIVCVTS